MKKILLLLIIVGLGVLLFNAVTSGYQVFGLNVFGYKDLITANDELDKDIDRLQTTISGEYENQKQYVAEAKSQFNDAKQKYDALAANATQAQLEAAMTKEEFLLDYLWILIGNYAEDNAVKVKFEVLGGSRIDFDATGSYVSMINFIYDLANDDELKFFVNGISLEAGMDKDTTTKAKFSVSGINVITKSNVAEI